MISNNKDISVSLKEIISPQFYSIHHFIKNNTYSNFFFKGGRGSTKSSFCAIEIVIGIIRDKNANAVVFRKVGNTVRKSVFETILWAMMKLGVDKFFNYTRSPSEITYLPTGQKIVMLGCDDPRKVKSIKIKTGYLKFLWFEEADEFNGVEEIRNIKQSVVRGGDNFIQMFSFNPPNDPANWLNVECGTSNETNIQDQDTIIHHSTYLDVDSTWVGEEFLKEALKLKIKNPLAYDHEYMGIAVGRAEQIVFHGYWTELEFETPDVRSMYQSRFFFGADWGFSQDPTTLIRSFIMHENNQKNLYIDYEAGGVGVELNEISKLFDSVPESRKWTIKADCSRPETISYVKQEGFSIEGAMKWQGSVEDGIEYLKSFDNIFIHPRCVKTIEEFKKHSYKIDKNTREILPIMVDAFNHYIDALRYALSEYIKKDVSILEVL